MIQVRSIFMLVFASVFAVAVLSTGCDEPRPQPDPTILADSTGPTPPPPAPRQSFSTNRQNGTITIQTGGQSVKVDLNVYTVIGTVSSDSATASQIDSAAPVQVSSITPANPWQMPTNGITDQPVSIHLGDTVSIRR